MGRIGYVDEHGEYHQDAPVMADILTEKTSVWKQSDHDRQRADHQWELIKPYLPNGEPNPEFIQHYPDESQTTYGFVPTDDDILKNQ